MSSSGSNLLVIGGAHVDRLARLKGPHRPQTSNPVSITEDIGGGSFNAARAARRFGLPVAMLSARGGDAGGLAVEEAMSAAGITDHSSVHLDRATPSYTAILEPGGELITAIADMALYETAIARSFRRAPVQNAAKAATAVLCDANLSQAGIGGIFAEIARGKPVYALAISASKVLRFRTHLPHVACLFMNRFEAAALTGLPDATPSHGFANALQSLGLTQAVITDGGNMALVMSGKTITRLTPPPVKIVDVTGAGDCLAGTIVAALLQGKDFIFAAKLGLAAASLTASRQGASPEINTSEIEAIAASHDWNLT